MAIGQIAEQFARILQKKGFDVNERTASQKKEQDTLSCADRNRTSVRYGLILNV